MIKKFYLNYVRQGYNRSKFILCRKHSPAFIRADLFLQIALIPPTLLLKVLLRVRERRERIRGKSRCQKSPFPLSYPFVQT